MRLYDCMLHGWSNECYQENWGLVTLNELEDGNSGKTQYTPWNNDYR